MVAAKKRRSKGDPVPETVVLDGDETFEPFPVQPDAERRKIRQYYREIENRISDEKDELLKATSGKFLSILNEVDNIHQQVMRPREQVSDAEALLGLASTFKASVKSHGHGGITPGEFISCLVRQFDKRKGLVGSSRNAPDILWRDIGSLVSPFLRDAPRCMTMIGPMKVEMKTRRAYTRRKRTVPVGNARPEKIKKASEVVTDTDRNVILMFKRLTIKHKQGLPVNLENLILNRSSFAQTVENLFALSFLVKDGRVEIKIDEDGSHVVEPCNGPSESQFTSGEVERHQFIFRFDFADWKLMKDLVVEGEELMPHRDVTASKGHDKAKTISNDEGIHIPEAIPLNSQSITTAEATQVGPEMLNTTDEGIQIPEAIPLHSEKLSTIPVKKFSRNYGHVNSCSDMSEGVTVASLGNWSCKRKRNVLSFRRERNTEP